MTGKWTFTSVLSDVPSEMLTSAEDHSAIAITSALEGFGRSWAITFVDTRLSDSSMGGVVYRRSRVERGRSGRSDEGCHCWFVLCDLLALRLVKRGLEIGRAHV